MENFILWLYNSFFLLINTITRQTILMISNIFDGFNYFGLELAEVDVNLVLFSDTPILSINFQDLLLLFFSVFYTVIFIVIVWKIIKKVFVKITRWNKW